MFVAVLAIWAAYLLQHWVRRREYLATARSVDRYSEAMRVLERRTPVLTNDAAPRQHPALLSRPQVTVVPASAEPAVRTPGDPVVTSAQTQTPAVGLSRGVARAVKVARMRPRSVPAPVRGLAFLVALVGLPVLLVLSVLGRTPWSAVLLDVVALALVALGALALLAPGGGVALGWAGFARPAAAARTLAPFGGRSVVVSLVSTGGAAPDGLGCADGGDEVALAQTGALDPQVGRELLQLREQLRFQAFGVVDRISHGCPFGWAFASSTRRVLR